MPPGAPPRVAELVEHADDGVIRDLPALAEAHRVAGCVHAVLEHTDGVADDVLERLAAGRREAASHHLVVRGVLARVGAVLDAADIPWLVFKGPVLSASVYCDPGMRRYSDVDVLVPPDRFADAVDAMEAARFWNPVTSWSPQVYFRAGAIAFNVGWISVDLHWHVMFKYQDRRWYHIDPEQLFARRRAVDIGGRRYATFDAVDTVFHLALDASREGCHRLVWLKDIEMAIATGRPDLDELVRRSARRSARQPSASPWPARSTHSRPRCPTTSSPHWSGVSGRGSCRRSPRSTASDHLAAAAVARNPAHEAHQDVGPRTASWTLRRISERRAEQRVNRVLNEEFDPNTLAPEELARNQAERETYFSRCRRLAFRARLSPQES